MVLGTTQRSMWGYPLLPDGPSGMSNPASWSSRAGITGTVNPCEPQGFTTWRPNLAVQVPTGGVAITFPSGASGVTGTSATGAHPFNGHYYWTKSTGATGGLIEPYWGTSGGVTMTDGSIHWVTSTGTVSTWGGATGGATTFGITGISQLLY